EVLSKENFIGEDLSSRLRKIVKFRNKLMHQYWEVDDKKILEYARQDIGDFEDFMKAVDKIL
ncbi:DUF86 domain-containing protein, partial [Patescibacteria group bacterium]|nr:DUF86 domain-containing protein [Patescibacteria group bacterium]